MSQRIAIVGGGIGGIATAYQLARDGVEFVLFEASARLGGIVETLHRQGFVIECGPDSWVTEKPWAHDLAVELGLKNQIIPSNDQWRRTYVQQGEGRLTRLMPIPDGMRMMVPAKWGPIARIAAVQLAGSAGLPAGAEAGRRVESSCPRS